MPIEELFKTVQKHLAVYKVKELEKRTSSILVNHPFKSMLIQTDEKAKPVLLIMKELDADVG